VAITLTAASAALAQSPQVPRECRSDAQRQVDWTACLQVTPADAPWRPLVLINLGTEALMRRDYASAVRYYDEAKPPGQQIQSDITFHAFRGVAYWRVERIAEAVADARLVYRMLHRDPSLPMSPQQYYPPGVDAEVMYAFILPILKDGDAAEFPLALAEFQAMPASDWVSYANRSAVLQEIGDTAAALTMSSRALEMAPTEPAVLNNHCYILFSLGRAQEALPHCESAVARAPEMAEVHHSLAEVFAALGRCAESEREIADARRLDPATVEYQRSIACNSR
jgi:Flp pilus assembly protein TadD